MRIAVPTDDGMSISGHFGKSAAFLIFEVENNAIRNRATTANGGCHSHGDTEAHGHAGIVSNLTGVDVVICAGIGGRAAEALRAGGIGEIVMTEPGPAAEAVKAYLAGTLKSSATSYCQCQH